MNTANGALLERLRSNARRPWVRWTSLLSLAIVILFAGAFSRELRGIYVFYADIAWTAAQKNEYLSLWAGSDPYVNKPPLLFWLAGWTMNLIGPTSFAATFWSRFFGVVCVALTVVLGNRLFGRTVGWLAGLALLTTDFFWQSACNVRMDTGLTVGILTSILGYLDRSRGWRGPLMFFGGIVVACLFKGPVGLIPVPLAILHFALSPDRSRFAWRCWACSSALLLIPVAWYAAQMQLHPDFIDRVLADANSTGEGRESGSRSGIVRYFGGKLLRNYWPWLAFLCLGFGLSARACEEVAQRSDRRATVAMLLAWISFVLLGAAWKNADAIRYLIAALPAMSCLAAWPLAWMLGGRLPAPLVWLPGLVALVGAILIASKPELVRKDTRPQISAMRTLLNERLAPGEPVAVFDSPIDRKTFDGPWCRFYLGREATTVTADDLATSQRATPQLLLHHVEVEPVLPSARTSRLVVSSATYRLSEIAGASGSD